MGTGLRIGKCLLHLLVLIYLLDTGSAETKGDPSYPLCTTPGKFRKNDNCQEYYVCEKTQTGFEEHRLACQHPLLFKQDWGFCVMPEMAPECAIVENPQDSKCIAPGRFSNRDCKGYIVCFPNFIGGGLRRMEVPCTPGTYYSEAFGMCALRPDADQKCVSEEDETEEERVSREKGQYCSGQGTFKKPGCHSYMVCVATEEGEYISHDFDCPSNLYFSEEDHLCVPGWEAPEECEVPEAERREKRFIEKRGTKKDCKRTGGFADKGCKTYYNCIALGDGAFKVMNYKCPLGLYYSEKLKICAPEQQVPECFPTHKPPRPTCATCAPCNGTTIPTPSTTTTAPTTTTSTTTTSTTTTTTTPYTTSKPPPGKCPAEGMFPFGEECKKFFICTADPNGGYLITYMTCSEGTYFAEDVQMCTKIVPDKCKETTTTTTTTTTTSTTTVTPPASSSPTPPKSTTPITPKTTTMPECKPPPCVEPGKFPVMCDCSMYYTCAYRYFGIGGPMDQSVYTCGENTFYNVEKERCTASSLVPECGGTTPPPGTTTPRSTTPVTPGSTSPVTPPPKTPGSTPITPGSTSPVTPGTPPPKTPGSTPVTPGSTSPVTPGTPPPKTPGSTPVTPGSTSPVTPGTPPPKTPGSTPVTPGSTTPVTPGTPPPKTPGSTPVTPGSTTPVTPGTPPPKTPGSTPVTPGSTSPLTPGTPPPKTPGTTPVTPGSTSPVTPGTPPPKTPGSTPVTPGSTSPVTPGTPPPKTPGSTPITPGTTSPVTPGTPPKTPGSTPITPGSTSPATPGTPPPKTPGSPPPKTPGTTPVKTTTTPIVTTTAPPQCEDILQKKEYIIDGLNSQIEQYETKYFEMMDELSTTVEDIRSCQIEASEKDVVISEQNAKIVEIEGDCESWLSKLLGK